MKILITLFFLLLINPLFCQVEWYNENTFENDLKYLLKNRLIDELLYIRLLDYQFKKKERLEFGKTSIYKMIDELSNITAYTSSTGAKDNFSYNISKRNNQESLIFKFELYNLREEFKIAKIDFAISVYHFSGSYFTSFEKTIVNPKERVTYSHKIKSENLFYSSNSKALKETHDFFIEKIGKSNVLKYAEYRLRYIKIELEDGTVINYDE